jgi:hypothetical protein
MLTFLRLSRVGGLDLGETMRRCTCTQFDILPLAACQAALANDELPGAEPIKAGNLCHVAPHPIDGSVVET